MITNLTQNSIKSIQPKAKRFIVWDPKVSGLGVRVMPTGVKTFILKYWSRKYQKQRMCKVGRCDKLALAEARKLARKLQVDIEEGRDPGETQKQRRDAPTVRDLYEHFSEDYMKVHLKPRTQFTYHQPMKNHILPFMGNMKVTDVVKADVIALHVKMKATPRHVNYALAVVRKMFHFAEDIGWRPERTNPVYRIKKYKENQRNRFLSVVELNRVGQALSELHSTENPWAVSAVKTLLLTGMRLGEVVSLEWSWIDLENGLIHLPDAKAGARKQPVSEGALDIFRSLPNFNLGQAVFLRANGQSQITTGAIDSIWKRIRKRAGLVDARIHDLRHTVGTYAGQTGANAFGVRDLLGHKTLAMTGQYVNQDISPIRTLANEVSTTIEKALNF